jgi:hypothetical protein
MTPEDKLEAFRLAKELLTENYHAHLNECRFHPVISSGVTDGVNGDYECPPYPTYDDVVVLFDKICTLCQ